MAGGEIVDWNLAALDGEIATAFVYDTKGTPRAPVDRFYVEHKAYSTAAALEQARIADDDIRVVESLARNAINQVVTLKTSRPDAETALPITAAELAA